MISNQPPVRVSHRKEWVGATDQTAEALLVEATKDRNLDRADIIRSDSKAARCLCNADYLNADFDL
jgi:hypothetical protein